MNLTKILIVFSLAAILFSCSSTKISSSWKAENADTRSLYDVMVWCIMPQSDSILRKQIETHLVNDLIGKGYHAFSSLDVYKSKAYKKITSQEIVDEFKSSGVNAVITMVLLKKEEENIYYPAGVFKQPVNSYGNLDKYYSNIYERVFTPGYYIKTTNYFWEANLFDVGLDKLVYSVHTNSFDPASTNELAHENGLKIMKDMLKKKVIFDKKTTEE